MSESFSKHLGKGNQAFKEKDFEQARYFYSEAMNENPELQELIKFNLSLIDQKITDSLVTDDSEDLGIFTQFDAEFYLKHYPDIKAAGIDPLNHYNGHGWKENRQPNPWFDPIYYLETYPEIKELKINPFEHYKKKGKKENKKPNPYIDERQLVKILNTGLFDKDFYLNQYADIERAGIDPLYHYVSAGYKEHRNPAASFDTFYYINKHDVEKCPLLHYADRPQVETLPDNAVILDQVYKGDFGFNKKVAIQAHVFYPDIAPQIKNYLNNIPFKFDLLVSVVNKADKVYLEKFFSDCVNVENIYAEVVENLGRDISPLIVTFKNAWFDYDYLCHIHTKRSPHTLWGELWRTYLFSKCLGSTDLIKNIVGYFENNQNTAILYPENFYKIKKYINSDENVDDLNNLLRIFGLEEEKSFQGFDFAAGSMQWFRTEHFRPLIEYGFRFKDFKETNKKIDGTLAHAMERFFALYALKSGYVARPYYTQGETNDLVTEASQYTLNYIVGDQWMRDDPRISANISNILDPLHNFYNKGSLLIHWVIPDFGIGAGGHMTIFRMVHYLEKLGHRQTIWIQNARNYKTPLLAKQTIAHYYQPIGENVDVHFLPDDTEWISGDVVFATDCWTAYPVRSMSKFKKRCYFIQDYEPMFHAMGENYLIAQQTYNFGFTAITAGPWLKKKTEDHGMAAYDFPLCADTSVYSVNKTDKFRIKDKINIAFYSRSYTPRRAVKLGLAGLAELAKTHQDIHVHCFGQDDLPAGPEFPYTNHGILSPTELAELYNSCDIGMVFSATNYSLIPLEMMGCGLPIVEMDVESTRYVFNENVVTFAQPNVVSIASACSELIDNEQKRNQQIASGLDFLKNISWKKAADNINTALYTELSNDGYVGLDIDSITNAGFSSKIHASVVVPTLNAEKDIKPLLDAVLSQKTQFSFDIIVIDSESGDSTPKILEDYASRFENITYVPIRRKDFQHGRTRDFGIEKSKGDYVAFLTQDALPYDENWLEELIKGFSVDEKIVGIFGKHVAYDEHSPFVKRDITNHFNHFDFLPKVYAWEDSMPSHIERGSLEWQMKMMFYSDNNSAIAKKAWQKITYPHVPWGEDQVWAWTIIQLGLKKYYANNAIVYHSHDDTYESRFKVSSIEKDFFYNNFGIKLIGSKAQADHAKFIQDKHDTEYSKLHGVSREELDRQLLLNEASITGRSGYEGSI